MSKLKTPQDKKQVSLANDRRNTYGENSKSSRKNIPLSKQLSHKATRRVSEQTLQETLRAGDEDGIVEAELRHRSKTAEWQRNEFTKSPDRALQDVLERKRTGVFVPRFSKNSKP